MDVGIFIFLTDYCIAAMSWPWRLRNAASNHCFNRNTRTSVSRQTPFSGRRLTARIFEHL